MSDSRPAEQVWGCELGWRAARFLMTANQVIDEIERLPEAERETVFQRVRELEKSLLPESFFIGMAEAEEGQLIDMEDHQFDQPPQS